MPDFLAHSQSLHIQPWHHKICQAITSYEYHHRSSYKKADTTVKSQEELSKIVYSMLSATGLPCAIQ